MPATYLIAGRSCVFSATFDQLRSDEMAKAKTPRTTKTATSKSRVGKNLLHMPENGDGTNGNGMVLQYSPADLEVEIRFRAYELYEQRGCTPGQEEQDWFAAEREILSRHDSHKHTA
jgi:hypothetical protein